MPKDETVGATRGEVEKEQPLVAKSSFTSSKISDHLANERTFLAWTRTGLATIAFGFVIERFGLLLRELALRNVSSGFSLHYSAAIGIALTLLGVIIMIFALLSFLQTRHAIDQENFHPQIAFAVLLTTLASLIGVTLAVYLWFTA